MLVASTSSTHSLVHLVTSPWPPIDLSPHLPIKGVGQGVRILHSISNGFALRTLLTWWIRYAWELCLFKLNYFSVTDCFRNRYTKLVYLFKIPTLFFNSRGRFILRSPLELNFKIDSGLMAGCGSGWLQPYQKKKSDAMIGKNH